MSDERIDDGGPAFPATFLWEDEESAISATGTQRGMSIRDYFAAAALTGCAASLTTHEREQEAERIAQRLGMKVSQLIAKACYDYADAMLAARKDKTK